MSAPARRFVSRGGEKLAAALERFAIDVTAMRALDAGCSTGGFTDVLLKAGAAKVVAVDVAYGQFDWGLRNDDRVELHERTNVRALGPELIGDSVDLIVADLAFIDLRKVREAFESVAKPDAQAILLIKPQFELPRAMVPRGGVVLDSAARRQALGLVVDAYREAGWVLLGACSSPVKGPKGNREFFVRLSRAGGSDIGDAALDDAILEVS